MIDCTGRQLGAYRLIGLLGHGGVASVYLGQHVFFNTEYAVKVWETPVRDLKQNALAEARTIVSLKHPHIIPVHYFDVDAPTGLPFLVMDYASGGNLRERYPKGMVLPPSVVCHYIGQVADALSYAHQRQIVHCDIKPENILIGQQGDVLLSDFGIAAVNPSLPHSKQREIQGTIEYMAPELFERLPSPKSDQYALGVVAYEWLCGSMPFSGETILEVIQQHTQKPPQSLTQRMPTISPEIEQVVFRALAKDPDERFPEVQDFAYALSAVCSIPSGNESTTLLRGATPLPISPTNQTTIESLANQEQVPPVQIFKRQPTRRTLLITGLAAGLITLGGTAWWTFLADHSPPIPACTPAPVLGSIASDGLITPGVLSWGADPSPPGGPYIVLDANGDPFGFEVDIANAIAQLMGITQVCKQMPYTSLELALQRRQIDIILNGWEITPGRQKNESFSAPYYRYSQQLVVRANDTRFSLYTMSSDITLTDFKNKGYIFGTGASYKAADLLRTVGITPLTFDNFFDALRQGTVDIIMVDMPIVMYYVLGKGQEATPSDTLRAIGKPLFTDSTSNYVIGFKKNDPNADRLRQEIGQALLALRHDGTLKSIYQQWGLWTDFQTDIGIIDCS